MQNGADIHRANFSTNLIRNSPISAIHSEPIPGQQMYLPERSSPNGHRNWGFPNRLLSVSVHMMHISEQSAVTSLRGHWYRVSEPRLATSSSDRNRPPGKKNT